MRKIPGIGEVTERALRALGIEYVHQLADAGLERLEKIFGQWGDALYHKARGGDSYEFVIDAEPTELTDDIESTPAMVENCFSSGVAMVFAERLRDGRRALVVLLRLGLFDPRT